VILDRHDAGSPEAEEAITAVINGVPAGTVASTESSPTPTGTSGYTSRLDLLGD